MNFDAQWEDVIKQYEEKKANPEKSGNLRMQTKKPRSRVVHCPKCGLNINFNRLVSMFQNIRLKKITPMAVKRKQWKQLAKRQCAKCNKNKKKKGAKGKKRRGKKSQAPKKGKNKREKRGKKPPPPDSPHSGSSSSFSTDDSSMIVSDSVCSSDEEDASYHDESFSSLSL